MGTGIGLETKDTVTAISNAGHKICWESMIASHSGTDQRGQKSLLEHNSLNINWLVILKTLWISVLSRNKFPNARVSSMDVIPDIVVKP